MLLDGIINNDLMNLIHTNNYDKLYEKLNVVENLKKESLVEIYSSNLKDDINNLEKKNIIYNRNVIPKIQKLFNVFVLDKFRIY